MKRHEIVTPLDDKLIESLHAGDSVSISGVIYAARDTAHKRIVKAIENGGQLPFELQGQLVYYVGPTPAPPGLPIGSAGPTTSSRMDPYAPLLIEHGLKAMLGKGERSDEVRKACQIHKAVYMATLGGCGALLGKCIKKADLIAYPELGPEGVWRFEVENFPAIVINDVYGEDQYEKGIEEFHSRNSNY